MAGNPVIDAAAKAVAVVKDPAVRQKALEAARKAASYVIPTDDANLTKLVKQGPGPAAVVLGGFARAGVNPDAFFDNIVDLERDQATARVLEALRQQYRATVEAFDRSAAIKQVSTVEDRLHAQAVIRFAAEMFGRSPRKIVAAHSMLRAFIGMDSKVLQDELTVNAPLFN